MPDPVETRTSVGEPETPLVVGVLCAGVGPRRWEAECLERLAGDGHAGIKAFVRIEIENSVPAEDAPAAPPDRRHRRPWEVFDRHFGAGASQAGRAAPDVAVIAGIPTLEARIVSTRSGEPELEPGAASHLRSLGLDVILSFLPHPVPREVVRCARWGVWFFEHGTPDPQGRYPIGLGEILRREPVTRSRLVSRRPSPDGDRVLAEGFFETATHSYSQQIDRLLGGVADWPRRACRLLAAGVSLETMGVRVGAEDAVRKGVGSRQLLQAVATIARENLAAQFQSLFRHDRWNLGWVDEPVESFLAEGYEPTIRWFPDRPAGGYLADGFAAWDGQRLCVLAERYDEASDRGKIVATERLPDGRTSPWRRVLDLPVHASYPYLLRHEGTFFLVPETAEAREVVLFRATDFPYRWERTATLLSDFPALDPTLFRHDGLWWLFCTDAGRGANTVLHAWFAEELTGPWRPHAGNPIKTDVRSSRPAGPPFIERERLYRPAQDCSRSYGGAVSINRILRLTPTEFEEETVNRILPSDRGSFRFGLHTLSGAGRVTLLDGKRRAFSWRAFRRTLGRKTDILFRGRS